MIEKIENLRIVVMVMVRVVLLGVPLDPIVLVVLDGGPKSHGDELIVRTSRFFAEPKMSKKERRMKNDSEKSRWDLEMG